MATLLYYAIRLLALVGVILYVVEAGLICVDVGFSCFGPCQPYPGSPDPIYANLTQTLTKVPSILLPAGVTLAIAWVVCLTLLMRGERWGWAFVVGLTLPLTTCLFLAAVFRIPDGLPHASQFTEWELYYSDWETYRQAVNVSYVFSLLGPLALLAALLATPSPPPEPPPYLAVRSS